MIDLIGITFKVTPPDTIDCGGARKNIKTKWHRNNDMKTMTSNKKLTIFDRGGMVTENEVSSLSFRSAQCIRNILLNDTAPSHKLGYCSETLRLVDAIVVFLFV